MKMQSAKLAFFSPTGTSRTIAKAIGAGLGLEIVEEVDAARPVTREQPLKLAEDQLLVVAVPVYRGRIPGLVRDWLKQAQLKRVPVIGVVVYGNREFDDALLELQDVLRERGAIPVACAAFIGEHSFSCADAPVAPGRPDAADQHAANQFGQTARKVLDALPEGAAAAVISVPGNRPYMEMEPGGAVDFIAVGEECTECGVCAQSCPVGAIDEANPAATDFEQCILCWACIKVCPEGARSVREGPVKDIARRLNTLCGERKEPVFFFPG